ncbi:hypothetical protein [Nonomuraea dietziae]|uniref:hypothetical protein n=1 Tax=Nonomuraea dietziae TaxID=65515 RepID=UPI0031D13077
MSAAGRAAMAAAYHAVAGVGHGRGAPARPGPTVEVAPPARRPRPQTSTPWRSGRRRPRCCPRPPLPRIDLLAERHATGRPQTLRLLGKDHTMGANHEDTTTQPDGHGPRHCAWASAGPSAAAARPALVAGAVRALGPSCASAW